MKHVLFLWSCLALGLMVVIVCALRLHVVLLSHRRLALLGLRLDDLGWLSGWLHSRCSDVGWRCLDDVVRYTLNNAGFIRGCCCGNSEQAKSRIGNEHISHGIIPFLLGFISDSVAAFGIKEMLAGHTLNIPAKKARCIQHKGFRAEFSANRSGSTMLVIAALTLSPRSSACFWKDLSNPTRYRTYKPQSGVFANSNVSRLANRG